MGALFIAGAGTGIGKTFLAAALVRYLRTKGHSAEAIKPVVTGFTSETAADSDTGLLLAAMGMPITGANLDYVSPSRFAAPLAPDMAARREGRHIYLRDLLPFCQSRLLQASAPIVVEGVGGVLSPVAEDATVLDLMRALDIPILLVGGTYLGAISHTLTAAATIAAAGLNLSSIVINESVGSQVTLADTQDDVVRFLPGICSMPEVFGVERHPATSALGKIFSQIVEHGSILP